ncbi:MAG: rod shape-determining protein MreC [Firmicutes bacterium]|nr:rod shape-determining protein MreC [Bacillota bacterium]
MKWIQEHKLISFLLAVILISLVILIASVASSGQGNPVSRALNGIYTAIEKPISGVAEGISGTVSGIFSYRSLQEENEALKKENEELQKQVTSLGLSANELKELKRLSKVLNYKGIKSADDLVSGDVISMDGTNWMNIFTINVGKKDGVKTGDVVVCGEGLVGRVNAVGNGWAKVTSIIDESSKVSFKIAGNLQIIGISEASVDGQLTGYMLDSEAKIHEGDEIITSGMGVYPAGIAVGKITKVKYDSDEQLLKVDIKPAVEFESLQKVSVIL